MTDRHPNPDTAPTDLTDITSIVWGGRSYPVTQQYGVPGFRADWYDYSKYHGFPAGYHIGLDVGLPKLTEVFAAESGVVTHAGFSNSFRPNPVIVESQDGYTDTYGHMWQDAVKEGDTVVRGQFLGYSGEQTYRDTMTPDTSGPHLHFERYDPNGVAVNPVKLLTTGAGGTTTKQRRCGIAKTTTTNLKCTVKCGNLLPGITDPCMEKCMEENGCGYIDDPSVTGAILDPAAKALESVLGSYYDNVKTGISAAMFRIGMAVLGLAVAFVGFHFLTGKGGAIKSALPIPGF